jgi:hypothetical protein
LKTKLERIKLGAKNILAQWYRFWFIAQIDERRLREIRDEHYKYHYLTMRN